MELLLILLLFVVVASTALPMLKTQHWMVRLFDFPYLQFSLFSVAGFVIFSVRYPDQSNGFNLTGLIISFISIIIRLSIVLPYTRLLKTEVKTQISAAGNDEISILAANVLMKNKNTRKLSDLVKSLQPQILILVETDQYWADSLLTEFQDVYRYKVSIPLDNTYGMIVFSKLKLSGTEVRYLVQSDVPSIKTKVCTTSGKEFMLYAIHPKPPVPDEYPGSLPRDAELVATGWEVIECDIPVIVAGDLNDVAWSHTTRLFMRLSGLKDPRKGRGFFNTYHANIPMLRWPLDHMFVSEQFRVSELFRCKSIDSDHYPIYMRGSFLFKNSGSDFQPDSADLEESKEILLKADEERDLKFSFDEFNAGQTHPE
ncbi:MAG: endonuclease/exonuclease/phosphatase family protein [Bacteroidia bacterium]